MVGRQKQAVAKGKQVAKKPVKKQEPRKKRVNREAETAVKKAKSLYWLAGVGFAIFLIGSFHDVFWGQDIGDKSNGVKKEIRATAGDVSEKYRLLDRVTESLKAKDVAGNVGNGTVVGYRSEFAKKDKDGDLLRVMVFVDRAGWLELTEEEQKKLVQSAGSGSKENAEYVGIQKVGVTYIGVTVLDNKSGEELATTQAGKLKKI
ncbi:hypothetical protein [Bacillus cereus]|uniref:hypothetical protein n=1 Tax=Bacillus cereus TaxID=1396 RepID=UPI000BFCF1BF|nr:hypothetical protein [Bacillus cereus]PGR83565.1 hypothetical protein COC63_06160 [Bacillus cereus]